MTINPLWLQNINYPARLDRAAFDALFTEGVHLSTSYVVAQSSPTAMTVQVSTGIAFVQGDDQANQGKYVVKNDAAVTNIAITAAPGSGQRNDLIVLKVRDQNAGVGTNNDALIQVINGTASASPVDPAIPDSALVLARVRVPAGTSAITNSLIDDLRVLGTANVAVKDNSVTSAKIVDGTIVNADISPTAAIDTSKLATGLIPSAVKVGSANFSSGVLPTDATITIAGTLSTMVGTVRYYFETARTVTNVVASSSIAPAGASLIFDVNKNGTTIFSSQPNRPTIAAGTNYDGSSIPDVTSFAAGDYLTVDIDQVGSTVPGADAIVRILFA